MSNKKGYYKKLDIHKENVILKKQQIICLYSTFENFCNKNNSYRCRKRLRNIMSRSTNKLKTIQKIFLLEMNVVLSFDQCEVMEKLLLAFIDKNEFRFAVSIDLKEKLLKKQNYTCNICQRTIDVHAHLDHIVPFKYVGDLLENNFQMLCCHCNTVKRDKIYIESIEK